MEFKRSNPIQLKIKAKTLAAEAVYIKAEERKAMMAPFRGKVRWTLAAYAKEYNYPKSQKTLATHILGMNAIGDRIVRDVLKRYIASLTPEQLDRFQRRRQAARDKKLLLRTHRINVVRREARATHLARAYLMGRPYADVEQKTYQSPLFEKSLKSIIGAMVLKYGTGDRRDSQQRFEEWCQNGNAYVEEYWRIMKSEQKAQAILQKNTRLLQ